MLLPSHDVIEVFNCPICSFNDTSLDGIAHHVRRHIKPEPDSVKVKVRHSSFAHKMNEDQRDPKGGSEKINTLEREATILERSGTPRKFSSLEQSKRKTINDCVLAIAKTPGISRQELCCDSLARPTTENDSNLLKRGRYEPENPKQGLPFLSGMPSPHLSTAVGVAPPVSGNALAPVTVIPGPVFPFVVSSSLYSPRANHEELYPPHPTYQVSPPYGSLRKIQPASVQQMDLTPMSPIHARSVYGEMYGSIGTKPSASPLQVQHLPLQNAARIATAHCSPKSIPAEQSVNMHYHPASTGQYVYRPLPVKALDKQAAHEIPVLVPSTDVCPDASGLRNPIGTQADIACGVQATQCFRQPPAVTAGPHSVSSHVLNAQLQTLSIPRNFPGGVDECFPVVIPNAGAVLTNNELLQKAFNHLTVDHLAGLLVVPLKRSSSVSTQTSSDSECRAEQVAVRDIASTSCQTDVLMGHITIVDPHASNDVFPKFSSLDSIFECSLCGDYLSHEVDFDEHFVRHHPYDCEVCLAMLCDQRSYTLHISQCGTKPEILQCDVCFESFGTLKALYYHKVKFHQYRMPFRCGVCNIPFESHSSVSEHVVAHTKEHSDLRCEWCSKSFRSDMALSKHIARHKAVSIVHECPFCKLHFDGTSTLHTHINKDHRELPNRQDERITKHCTSQESSQAISLKFSSLPTCSYPRESSDVVNAKSSVNCDRCHGVFQSFDALSFHACPSADVFGSTGTRQIPLISGPSANEMSHSLSSNPMERRGQPATLTAHGLANEQVTIRPDALRPIRTLDDPYASQHSLSVIQCPECREIFTSKDNLAYHMKERHGLVASAPTCLSGGPAEGNVLTSGALNVSYVDEKLLKDIQGFVRCEKPFKCTMCPLSFQYSGQVIWHMKDHETEKAMKEPPVADTADKYVRSPSAKSIAFSTPWVAGHSGAEGSRVLCKACDLEFMDVDQLRLHEQDTHKITHVCETCKMRFIDADELEWHRSSCMKPRATLGHDSNAVHSDVYFKSSKANDSSYQETTSSAFSDPRLSKVSIGIRSQRTSSGEFDVWDRESESSRSYKDYLCRVCGATFESLSRYQQHKDSHFAKEPNPTVEMATTKESASTTSERLALSLDEACREDSKRDKSARNSSVTSHHCGVCFDEFATYTALKRHSRDSHHSCGDISPSMGLSTVASAVVGSARLLESPPELKRVDSNSASLDGTTDVQGMPAAFQERFLQEEPPYDYKTGEYFCTICHKTTRSTTGMKTHYGRCHGIWGKRSTHHQTSVDVYSTGHGENTSATSWSCNFCDKGSATYHGLRTHIMRMHKDLVDHHDEDLNPTAPPADVDVSSSVDYPSYTCSECKSRFSSETPFRLHLVEVHQQVLTEEQIANCKSTFAEQAPRTAKSESYPRFARTFVKYRCRHCKASFHTVRAIRLHTFETHEVLMSKKDVINSKEMYKTGENSFPRRLTKMFINRRKGHDLIGKHAPCDRCGRVFGNYRALFTHYRQAHRILSSKVHMYRKPSKTEIVNAPSSLDSRKDVLTQETIRVPSPSARRRGEDVKIEAAQRDSPPPSMVSDFNKSPIYTSPHERAESKAQTRNDLNVPSIDCPVCGKVFYQHKSLMAHLCKAHHVYKESYSNFWPQGMPILPRERSFCPICGKEYVDERAMRIHIFKAHKMHHTDIQSAAVHSERESLKDTTGEQRSAALLNASLLSSPESRPHPFTKSSKCNDFTCPRCGTDFVNRRALTTHLCRMHGYKRHHINRLFGEGSKTFEEAPSTEGVFLGDYDRVRAADVKASPHDDHHKDANTSSSHEEHAAVSLYGMGSVSRSFDTMNFSPPTNSAAVYSLSAKPLVAYSSRKARYHDLGRKARYACPRCGNTFVSPHAVRVHVGRAHGKGLVSKKLHIGGSIQASNEHETPNLIRYAKLAASELQAVEVISPLQEVEFVRNESARNDIVELPIKVGSPGAPLQCAVASREYADPGQTRGEQAYARSSKD